MERLSARGKYLYDNGQKFFVRGVLFGPLAPNSRGERFPEPDQVVADFVLMVSSFLLLLVGGSTPIAAVGISVLAAGPRAAITLRRARMGPPVLSAVPRELAQTGVASPIGDERLSAAARLKEAAS